MTLEINKPNKMEHTQNERNSGKSCSTTAENQCISPLPSHFISAFSSQFRFQLFEVSEQGTQISQKVSQRAISWLITICWSKNLSQQCLWLSVLLFYSCKAKRRIIKEDLQLTLLTCLSLSIKMIEKQCYSPKTLAALSSKQLTASEIITQQENILQIVEYNLVIPHQLQEIMFVTTFQKETLYQILMICQLMMVKDYNIFINHIKLECIVKILRGQQMQNQSEKSVLLEIRDLLQLKQCTIILHKYSSKIDTEQLKRICL